MLMPENICLCRRLYAYAGEYMLMPENICLCRRLYAYAGEFMLMPEIICLGRRIYAYAGECWQPLIYKRSYLHAPKVISLESGLLHIPPLLSSVIRSENKDARAPPSEWPVMMYFTCGGHTEIYKKGLPAYPGNEECRIHFWWNSIAFKHDTRGKGVWKSRFLPEVRYGWP